MDFLAQDRYNEIIDEIDRRRTRRHFLMPRANDARLTALECPRSTFASLTYQEAQQAVNDNENAILKLQAELKELEG